MNSQGQSSQFLNTIDRIFEHHYFQTRLEQLIQNRSTQPVTGSSFYGPLEDQFYKKQSDVVQEIVDAVNNLNKLSIADLVGAQMDHIGKFMEDIREQVMLWLKQQQQKLQNMQKDLNKTLQQINRKAQLNQAMSNTPTITTITGGIRFLRSSKTIGQTESGPVVSEPKSVHSQVTSMKRDIQELRDSLEKGQNWSVLEQRFNQFKIETKIALETLKQQSKRLSIEIQQPKNQNQGLTSQVKQNIESTIKRIISSQLKVFGSYSDSVIEMKQEIEQIHEKIDAQAEQYKQYLSMQLKNVWLVLNDMKGSLDEVTEHVGLNSSSQLL